MAARTQAAGGNAGQVMQLAGASGHLTLPAPKKRVVARWTLSGPMNRAVALPDGDFTGRKLEADAFGGWSVKHGRAVMAAARRGCLVPCPGPTLRD